MGNHLFTQEQVDELIQRDKYIHRLPQIVKKNNKLKMTCLVFVDKECKQNIGLRIEANIAINSVFNSEIKPSIVLLWHNINIRRINWKLQHLNINDEVIENWHEHKWSDEHEMSHIVPIDINNPTLQEFFNICLNHWNIHIVEGVEPSLFEGEP